MVVNGSVSNETLFLKFNKLPKRKPKWKGLKKRRLEK